MTEKLKNYQVLDVLCGGTFYKVRHKVTNNIFAWKACNCSLFTDEQIQWVASEVKTISKVVSENLLRYYDTILHAPSKTLYFVLEHNSWQSLEELISICKSVDKYIAESFIWYLLHELAQLCKEVEDLRFTVLQKCISSASIFVDQSGELRVNCFDLPSSSRTPPDVMRQVGDVIHTLCYRSGLGEDKIKEFHYSDDLQDVVCFLTDDRNCNLRPDVILYHPTVLANLETLAGPKNLSEIMVSVEHAKPVVELNKCDSEKVVELCRVVAPAPRNCSLLDSPIYSNLNSKKAITSQLECQNSLSGSLSPTIAALALELPGFVPRSRKPLSQALETYKSPQRVSEKTLSQQWMSRLISLRQREESLNKRERDIIAKEIINSPSTKLVPLVDAEEECSVENNINGITLPPMIRTHAREDSRSQWVSRRHRRSSSVRMRSRHRKSFGYEDLDSSLSADPGDGSIIVTATKITKENMPHRNIFPEISSKKVHFTSSNPFTESDESVTLTFYDLENVDQDGYQVPKKGEKIPDDINKFKYLDLEKATLEKRQAMNQWNQSSPSKQAKIGKVFSDITNTNGIKRTPSKFSIMSKSSSGTQCSNNSSKSQWSFGSDKSKISEGYVSDRTRSSVRMSLAPLPPQTELKKPKSRKSLLSFKTPFKFMSSTKI